MSVRHSVSVEARFSATHQIRLANGELEPLHGHDWVVRVYLSTGKLDPWDMVVDFEHARAAIDAHLAPLQHANLNRLSDFSARNPTAETVAEWLLVRLRAGDLPTTRRVEVTEAPGCVATAEWSDP